MKSFLLLVTLAIGLGAQAEDLQLKQGREAILGRTGCYLVDYSFVETESLKPGYVRDPRVYDVNQTKSVKEWIYADDLGPGRIRLQHVLFAADVAGQVIAGSILKHQAEDWDYGARFFYDFTAPLNWTVRDLTAAPGLWRRAVTNLDDGLRYQCASTWSLATAFPEWTCDGFAPIPGRETRDMGRKDYNTLERATRIIAYKDSWLEREHNVKTIYDAASASKTPLVREVGKTWYVRLPDTECAQAKAYAQTRAQFWKVLRETWGKVLVGDRPFIETAPATPSRYQEIMDLEDQYISQDLTNPARAQAAEADVLKVIDAHRVK